MKLGHFVSLYNSFTHFSTNLFILARYATLSATMSVGRSVRPSVRRSKITPLRLFTCYFQFFEQCEQSQAHTSSKIFMDRRASDFCCQVYWSGVPKKRSFVPKTFYSPKKALHICIEHGKKNNFLRTFIWDNGTFFWGQPILQLVCPSSVLISIRHKVNFIFPLAN